MQRSTRILGTILIVLLVVGVAEFMAYVKTCQMVKYDIGFIPLDITESYDGYMDRHDPQVGWVTPPDRLDAEGSRPIPAFPDPLHTKTCVSLYGDSFTEGAFVDNQHAWSNILARLLNCRVANFGVSGYGTDQAYIRFFNNHSDQARVVVLGFLSENLMRNVNQLRNLISPSTACLLKPRFVLSEQGKLTLVPISPLTKEAFNTLKEHPERTLSHEFFLPGSPSGYQRVAFPYTWGIIKAFPIIYRNLLLHRPTYFDLYQPGHPSQAVPITLGIMEAFCREAKKRGKQPLVLIIPTHFDIIQYRRDGKWVYQPLVDLMVKQNLEFLDAGPRIVKHLGDAGVETLYSPQINNHLNEKGNGLLARIVYEYLRQKNVDLGRAGETAGQ
jgi:hypothetical protein